VVWNPKKTGIHVEPLRAEGAAPPADPDLPRPDSELAREEITAWLESGQPAVAREAPVLTAEDEERLRSLGYLE
jgi:hypothetical protein